MGFWVQRFIPILDAMEGTYLYLSRHLTRDPTLNFNLQGNTL